MFFGEISYSQKFTNGLALAERGGLSYTDIALRFANANPFMNFYHIDSDSQHYLIHILALIAADDHEV